MKIKEIKIVNQDQSTEVANIGADAINVDYNDTTVKNELDKLNSNNNSLINKQTDLQNQINGLASGSPLVASSTSEMTDTSRTYVNTSDGKWYYYNGTTWTIGGTYQSTQIGENTIDFENFTSNLKTVISSLDNSMNTDDNKIDSYVKIQNYFIYSSDDKFYKDSNFDTLIFKLRKDVNYSIRYNINDDYSFKFKTINIGVSDTLKTNQVIPNLVKYKETEANENFITSYTEIKPTTDAYLYVSYPKSYCDASVYVNLTKNIMYENLGFEDFELPQKDSTKFAKVQNGKVAFENYSGVDLYIIPITKSGYYKIETNGLYLAKSYILADRNGNALSYYPENDTVSEHYYNKIIYCEKGQTLYINNTKFKGVNIKYINWLNKDNRNYEIIKSFKTWGFIGDSLSSGECNYMLPNDEHVYGYQDYDISWGQFMVRKMGRTGHNFSTGGLYAKSWLNSTYATECFNGNNPCDVYTIGLGVNDRLHFNTQPLGTINDIDISNYNNNADTFYGNYGKIIQKIHELYPKAKIFCMTDPKNYNENINNAIRAITNKLNTNTYLIDLQQYYNNEFLTGFINSQFYGAGHYTAAGYEAISEVLYNAINNYMINNYTEFKNIQFINTEYDFPNL